MSPTTNEKGSYRWSWCLAALAVLVPCFTAVAVATVTATGRILLALIGADNGGCGPI